MRIAERLTEVDTSMVSEPFHNPTQFITSNNHIRQDHDIDSTASNTDALRNSMNQTNSGHIKAPSIH